MCETGKTCPNARCEDGNLLLGVKGPDGHLQRMRTALPVDENFVETATGHGQPEARMRFASDCAEKGCDNWIGDRCRAIDRVLSFLAVDDLPPRDRRPPCPIRATCRWFSQSGDSACHACSVVIADPGAIAAE